MKVSIFGLGYVGCVSAACLAKLGHDVIGVDVHPRKVDIINDGRSPVVEPGIGELIAEAVAAGRLRATADVVEAVEGSEVSLICVGTPGKPNGSLDLTHVQRVCRQIGAALSRKRDFHVVALRSTVLPGTTTGVVIPALEACSGKRAGAGFGVAVNPEFLREGTSVSDFHEPPFTLLGSDQEAVSRLLRRLYARIGAPVVEVGVKEAEMVKYACNSFHALKVAFANEIGVICKGLGVDSHRVMDVFCRDTKLNISPAYLRPGFAFGGSCLPKDLRALTYKAKELDLDVPVLNAVMSSNRRHIERAVDMVLQTRRKSVGVLGLSFKPNTDDLRESPMVTLIETLLGKGLKLAIYDREVRLAQLFGANKDYIEREIPHISSLLRANLREVIECSEVIVIGKRDEEFSVLAQESNNGRVIIDLVRLWDAGRNTAAYQGLGW